MTDGDASDDLVVWAGPWAWTEAEVRVAGHSRVSVVCAPQTPPRFRVQATAGAGSTPSSLEQAVKVGSGVVEASDGGGGYLDVRLSLATGTPVEISSEGVSADVSVQGECGAVTVTGAATGTVTVEGGHARVAVSRPAASVDVDIPHGDAVRPLDVLAEWAVVRVPARDGYHGGVPVGWAVACPFGVDAACGSEGPTVIGASDRGFSLRGPGGVLRIIDWRPAPPGMSPPRSAVTRLERRLGSSLPVNRAPACFDVLKAGCGWPWEDCVPR